MYVLSLFNKASVSNTFFFSLFVLRNNFFCKIKNNSHILFDLVNWITLILEKSLLNNLISQLNQSIYNFNLEDKNYNREALNFSKEILKFDLSSIYFLVSNIFMFWFKPIIYDVTNITQMIQSLENILVLIVIFYYLNKLSRENINKTYFNFFFDISIDPYAIIVSNIGTLARYRFSIVFVFIVILFIEFNKSKKIMQNKKNFIYFKS